ncbi:hypothetical protein TRFO_12891 [Tritrichomonas foetus]|uniref:PAS domain-containing protein n=1 Tax=Tritrichomonas foetus TaxID=1144522 RepID=A0A1J4L4E1_9EUKA|nr:hypothetical protein TRFO_12891 [Tritrichomonas foetus]|eukprot:OHT16814.1 hypothetical protein TRFO_12891 [Tritrichomonas foetus]
MAQIGFIGLLPSADIWNSYPPIKSFFMYTGICSIPFNSLIYNRIIYILLIYYIVTYLLSLLFRFIFVKKRIYNVPFSTFIFFLRPITDLVLYPISSCYLGSYIIHENEEQNQNGLMIIVSVSLFSFISKLTNFFIGALHFKCGIINPFFRTVSSTTCSQIYIILGIVCFITNASNSVTLNVLVNFIAFMYLFLIQFYLPVWINYQFSYIAQTMTLFASISSIIVYFFNFNPEYPLILWILFCLLIIIYFFVQFINKRHISTLQNQISNIDKTNSFINGKHAAFSLIKIFLHDKLDIYDNVFSFELIRMFPTNYYLNLYFAFWSLLLSDIPVSLESVFQNLFPHRDDNDIELILYRNFLRYIGPIIPHDFNQYFQNAIDLQKKLISLLYSQQMIYEAIYDELTMNIPLYALNHAILFEDTTYSLLKFIQSYPNSPFGQFYIDIYDAFFPNAEVISDLKFWHNIKFDHLQSMLGFIPSLGKIMNKEPKLFKSREPDYSQTPTVVESEEMRQFLTEKKTKTPVSLFPNFYGPNTSSILKMKNIFMYCFLFLFMCYSAFYFMKIDISNLYHLNNVHSTSLFLKSATALTTINSGMNFSLLDEKSKIILIDFVDSIDKLFRFEMIDQRRQSIYSTQYNFNQFINQSADKLKMNMTFYNALLFSLAHAKSLINGTVNQEYNSTANRLLNETMNKELSEFDDVTQIYKTNFYYLMQNSTHDILNSIYNSLFSSSELLYSKGNVQYLFIAVLFVALFLMIKFFSDSFIEGKQKFNIFFQSLNETSKRVLNEMKNDISRFMNIIDIQEHQKHFNKPFSLSPKIILRSYYVILFIFSLFLITLLLIRRCFLLKLKMTHNMNKSVVEASFYASSFVNTYNKMTFLKNTKEENEKYFKDLLSYQSKLTYFEWLEMNMTMLCHFCSQADFYKKFGNRKMPSTYFSLFYKIIELHSIHKHNITNQHRNNQILSEFDTDSNQNFDNESDNQTSTKMGKSTNYQEPMSYYINNIISNDQTYIATFLNYVHGNLITTFHAELILILILIILIILFPIYTLYAAHYMDKPYMILSYILKGIPHSSFSPSALSILVDGKFIPKENIKETDDDIYSNILEQVNEAAIIVDLSFTILQSNKIAQSFYNEETTESIIGRNLFEVLTIEFTDNNKVSLRSILEQYLISHHKSVFVTDLIGKQFILQKYNYKLTILPLTTIDDKTASKLALFFYDKTDIEKFETQIKEEKEKPTTILNGILPKELIDPLFEHKKSLLFYVQTTVFSVVKIESKNQSLYDCIFDIVNVTVSNYSNISYLMNESCSFFFGSGFYIQEIENRIHVNDSLNFCFDLLDRLHSLSNCTIKIGCAFGGPLIAYVVGVHKPTLDICSELLTEAITLEIDGYDDKIHVNSYIVEIIHQENLNFDVIDNNDNTYYVTRKPFLM